MPRLTLFALFFCFVLVSSINAQSPPKSGCDVLVQALQDTQMLKPGDMRVKLDENFLLDGGLQFRTKTRYMFKKCHYIRIDVDFEVPTDNKMEFAPTDKILSVSKPYLAYPTMD